MIKWRYDSFFLDSKFDLQGYGETDVDVGINRDLKQKPRFEAVLGGAVERISLGYRANSKAYFGDLEASEDDPLQQSITIEVYLDDEETSSYEETFGIDITKLDELQYTHILFEAVCDSIAIKVVHRRGKAFELDYIGVSPKGTKDG